MCWKPPQRNQIKAFNSKQSLVVRMTTMITGCYMIQKKWCKNESLTFSPSGQHSAYVSYACCTTRRQSFRFVLAWIRPMKAISAFVLCKSIARQRVHVHSVLTLSMMSLPHGASVSPKNASVTDAVLRHAIDASWATCISFEKSARFLISWFQLFEAFEFTCMYNEF